MPSSPGQGQPARSCAHGGEDLVGGLLAQFTVPVEDTIQGPEQRWHLADRELEQPVLRLSADGSVVDRGVRVVCHRGIRDTLNVRVELHLMVVHHAWLPAFKELRANAGVEHLQDALQGDSA